MNPTELLNKVKEFIENKDFDAAKAFIEDHKDDLGSYLEQAQKLVSGSEGLNGVVDKLKNLF